MSVSFVGSAVWVGVDPAEVVRGLVRIEMPGSHGAYDPSRVALAMIGAVGGSLMNLAYPYFLEAKGWRGPAYRRVQLYDFILGIVAMLVLNLAVWVLGAELLFPDKHIERLEDLPDLLSVVLGATGTDPLLRGNLRRDLHVDHRPRGGTRPARHTRVAPVEGGNRADRHGLPESSVLSLDRNLVPRVSADLDAAWHAWIRGADARRQQRAGRAAADAARAACGGSPRANV